MPRIFPQIRNKTIPVCISTFDDETLYVGTINTGTMKQYTALNLMELYYQHSRYCFFKPTLGKGKCITYCFFM